MGEVGDALPEPELRKRLGKSIGNFRRIRQISTNSAAFEIGTTKKTWEKIESGWTGVSFERLHKIARLLEVRMADLFACAENRASARRILRFERSYETLKAKNPHQLYPAIGLAIRHWRKVRGLVLLRLCDQIGWGRRYWLAVEQGKEATSILSFVKVARQMNCLPSDLMAIAESLPSSRSGSIWSIPGPEAGRPYLPEVQSRTLRNSKEAEQELGEVGLPRWQVEELLEVGLSDSEVLRCTRDFCFRKAKIEADQWIESSQVTSKILELVDRGLALAVGRRTSKPPIPPYIEV